MIGLVFFSFFGCFLIVEISISVMVIFHKVPIFFKTSVCGTQTRVCGTQRPNFRSRSILKMSIDLVSIFCLSIDRSDQEQHQIYIVKRSFVVELRQTAKTFVFLQNNVLLICLSFSAAVLYIIKRLYGIADPWKGSENYITSYSTGGRFCKS